MLGGYCTCPFNSRAMKGVIARLVKSEGKTTQNRLAYYYWSAHMNWLSFLLSKETLLSVRWELLTFSLWLLRLFFCHENITSIQFFACKIVLTHDLSLTFAHLSWVSAPGPLPSRWKVCFSIFHSQFHYSVQNYACVWVGCATLSRSCRARIRRSDWPAGLENVFSTFFVFQVIFWEERERNVRFRHSVWVAAPQILVFLFFAQFLRKTELNIEK